ncbi:MAG: hypothetical protein ACYC1C_07525 [Chloroflexota bacterium]
MAFDVYSERGTPLEKQWRNFQQIVGKPYDKDSVDAYTRARIIWMYGTETEQWYFYHNYARSTDNEEIKKAITEIRRTEDQQRSALTYFFDPTSSVLEITLGYEQLAVDLTAAIAKDEPDDYVKQTLDFALIEDFDHLFRYSVLMSRIEPNKDPAQIVRHKTDIKAGRPTAEEHRHPLDTLRNHVNAKTADPISLVHILSIVAPEQQVRQYYMSQGYFNTDEEARRLYAEIGEIEEQHVTQYEALMDPTLSMLEMAFIHEYNEAYDYYSCLQMETDQRFKSFWERELAEEVEHIRIVGDLLKKYENKDPQQLMPGQLPKPIMIQSAKDYVNNIIQTQRDLRPYDKQYMQKDKLPQNWPSYEYLKIVDAANAPSTHFEQFGKGGMQTGQRGPEFRM